MVAKMTDMDKPVYYYENTEGGHGSGAKSASFELRVLSFEFRIRPPGL